MDFVDKVRELAQQARKWLPHIQTEEATKTSLVLPFIRILGYDTENPLEVVPEYTADLGTKKGEKVDYAILRDGKVVMLFECKWSGADLDKNHASQLFRYFSVTDARFGVLTNGVVYRFFSDLEEANKMDTKPFLEFNVLEASEELTDELKRFTKDAFDPEAIFETARTLKYTREISRAIADVFADPSGEFVRFFASKVYSGNITTAVKEQFATTIKSAFHEFISHKISDRLKSALAEESVARSAGSVSAPAPASEPSEEPVNGDIVTTSEEIEAFFIVKAIVHDIVDVKRVVMRDKRDYCAVLLDDNQRKPICRFYFNEPKKLIAFIAPDRTLEKIPIDDLNDLYNLSERFMAAIRTHDRGNSDRPDATSGSA